MIGLKDIVNRVYENNEAVKFEYEVCGLSGHHGEKQSLRVWFEKVDPLAYGLFVGKPVYKMFTFIDGMVYEKVYQMPKAGMNLEMVVATGLNLLVLMFREEIAYKEMISYTISDIVKDM